jgi:hypothetical protein
MGLIKKALDNYIVLIYHYTIDYYNITAWGGAMATTTGTRTSGRGTISLYITEEVRRDFEILAKAKGKTVSSLVEELMVSYLEKNRMVLKESKIKLNLIEAVQENKEFKNLHTEIYNILKESKEK